MSLSRTLAHRLVRSLRTGFRTFLFLAPIGAFAIFAAFSNASATATTPLAPSVVTYASDAFNRTVATGWGNADLGGAYDSSGGAASSNHVSPGLGSMVVALGDASHLAQLGDVSARDVDVHVQVQANRAAAGDSQFATVIARRASGNTEYRFRIRYGTNGSVGIQAQHVVFSYVVGNGSEVVVPGLTATPNVPISVHVQALGANPTTLRMNAWSNTQTEPATWQYSAVDSTPDLQEAGMVGLGASLGPQSTGPPVTFAFSNYLAQSVGPPANVIWKPYLDQVGSTSAIVQWTTYAGANPQVYFSTDTSYSSSASGTSWTLSVLGYQFHKVALTGLQPGTAYFYKILNDGTDELPAETLSFTTAPVIGNTSPFTFLSFGDYGSNSATQKQLRDRMLQESFRFILTLGDNAYPNGTYQNFNANVFPVYRDIFDRAGQFSVLGNHDVVTGNGAPELDLFNLPQTAVNAADQERYYSFDWGNAHFVVLDSNASLNESTTNPTSMYAWLRNDLAQTIQPWKIVAFHHPAYSANGNTALVVTNLVPIFEQYGVDLVLTGHIHDYERTFPLKQGAVTTTGQGGIVYVVSGSGDSDSQSCAPVSFDAFQLCHSSRGNYSRVSLNNSQITLQQVDYTGSVVDSFSWSKTLPTATVTSTPTTTATPTSRATATMTSTATDTPTMTPLVTMTPTSTPSDTATSTPTTTDTATGTPTPTDTATSTPIDTATSTSTPTDTATSTPTPSDTATNSPTPTDTATRTPTPSDTATSSPTTTDTATSTSTPTDTATSTPTPSVSATSSPTPSGTPTATPTDTPTNSATATNTPTSTASPTNTPTNSATATATPSATSTPLPTNTPTNSPTATVTRTATITPTLTATPTMTRTSTPTRTSTATATLPAGGVYTVYADALASGWVSAGWGSTVNLASTSYVHSGTSAVSYTITAAYGAFAPALSTGSFDTTPYTNIRFWVNGEASGGQQLALMVRFASTNTWGKLIKINPYIAGGSVAAGQWRLVDLPLSVLGASNTTINRFALQDIAGTAQPSVSVDDIQFYNVNLTASPTVTPSNTPTAVAINTLTVTPTNSPTVTSINTATASPTISPTVQATNTPTVSPTNTPTATSSQTVTPTPTPTV